MHEAEYCYAFDSLAHVQRPWRPVDVRLADLMSSYWANFAARGDPNGEGLPVWPTYGSSPADVMEFGDRVAAVPAVLGEAKARLWADEYAGNPGGIPDVYDWNGIRF
jgi:para-nitrobenzyl esterase